MNKLFKTSINYGAMCGLSSFAFFLLLYFTGHNPLGQINWLGAWIPVVFMVLATKHFRDYEAGGYITYSQGFSTGLFTAVSGGFLFSLLIWSFGTVIDPSIVDMFKEESMMYLQETEKLSKSMMGEKMFDAAIENLEKTNIGTLASQEFVNKTMGGLIVALITAAIFKRNPPLIHSDEK